MLFIACGFCIAASWALGLAAESRLFLSSFLLFTGCLLANQTSKNSLPRIASLFAATAFTLALANVGLPVIGRECNDAVLFGIEAILYAFLLQDGNPRRFIRLLIPAFAISVVFDSLMDANVNLFYQLNILHEAVFARLTQLLSGRELHLGTTYLDFGTLIFVFVSCWALVLDKRRPMTKSVPIGLAYTMAIVIAWASAPFLLIVAEDFYEPFLTTPFSAILFDVSRVGFVNLFAYISHGHSGWFFCVIAALLIYVAGRKLEIRCEQKTFNALTFRSLSGSHSGRTLACWFVFAAIALFAFVILQPARAIDVPKQIVIHDPSGAWTHRLGTIEARPSSNGFFSQLPMLLEIAGSTVTKCNLQKESIPKGTEVIVLANLEANFPDQQMREIREFVSDGGSVLCLGDHTGKETIRFPYNRLMKGTGIEFNFDSACPFRSWDGRIRLNPSLAGLSFGKSVSKSSISYGTGASLKIQGNARAIGVACGGFVDPGQESAAKTGFLGNLNHDFGEATTDFVLIAEGRLGKGRFLAFGDTSPFQTGSLPNSYLFVLSTFSYLGSNHPDRLAIPMFSFLLLNLGVLIYVTIFATKIPYATHFASTSLILVFGLFAFLPQLSIRNVSKLIDCNRIAFIDQCNLPKYCRHVGTPLGMDCVVGTFERLNLFPIVLGRIDSKILSLGRCLISIEPLQQANSEELLEYIRSGGTYMLVADGTNMTLKSLAAKLGLDIKSSPLGEFETKAMLDGKEFDLHFVSGWEIPKKNEFDMSVDAWGKSVIFRMPVGKGYFVYVADGRFLTEKNTEQKSQAIHPHNAEIAKILIEKSLVQSE